MTPPLRGVAVVRRLNFWAAMTPYAHALELFSTGLSFDEVIAQLRGSGLSDEDARVAAYAARKRPAEPAAATEQAGVDAAAFDMRLQPVEGQHLLVFLGLCMGSVLSALQLCMAPFELMLISRSDAPAAIFIALLAAIAANVLTIAGTAGIKLRWRRSDTMLLSALASMVAGWALIFVKATPNPSLFDWLELSALLAYARFWWSVRNG